MIVAAANRVPVSCREDVKAGSLAGATRPAQVRKRLFDPDGYVAFPKTVDVQRERARMVPGLFTFIVPAPIGSVKVLTSPCALNSKRAI